MRAKRTSSALPPTSAEQGLSPAERSLRARLAAHSMHARHDPRETTTAARAAFLWPALRPRSTPTATCPPRSGAAGPSMPAAPTSPAWPWPRPRPAAGAGVRVVRPRERGQAVPAVWPGSGGGGVLLAPQWSAVVLLQGLPAGGRPSGPPAAPPGPGCGRGAAGG
jgi:hypothetical protein